MAKSEKGLLVQPKMKPTVCFNFDENLKAPASFGNLTIGAEVTATVTGKVKTLDSQFITIEMKKVDLSKIGPKTIAEAKMLARERVKNFK
jgi:hypothetical protein